MYSFGYHSNHRLATASLYALFLVTLCSGCGSSASSRPDTTRKPGIASSIHIQYPIELVGPTVDWRPQDWHESRGITKVHYDEETDRLLLECVLDGSSDSLGSGEGQLDFKRVPTLGCSVPVDFSSRTLTVEFEVPPGFIGPGWAPNGVQLIFWDHEWRSAYSTWLNVEQPGIHAITFTPSTETPVGGDTTPGFDPTRIRLIGIKFAINDNSNDQFVGHVYVRKVEITPPLPFASPPELPAERTQAFLTGNARVSLRDTGFYVGNAKWIIIGGNWRVLEYGQTLGTTAWFPFGNGVSRHLGYVAAKLQDFRKAGITLVRVGLLDDGRTMLDREGIVIGFDDTFRNDAKWLLDCAHAYDIKVEFVLVDFLLAGKGEEVDGVWLRGRRKVIEDPVLREQFLANFLDRFLDEFGLHPALFGIDVINEPEWLISQAEGGGWETVSDLSSRATTPVPANALKEFVSQCAYRIRQKARGKFVTVGTSAVYVNLVLDLDLDYRAIHYYPWMGDFENILADIPEDRPWMLEEFPSADPERSVCEYIEGALGARSVGALLWNLSPDIDPQTFSCEQEEARLQQIRTCAGDISPTPTP